MHRVIYVQLPIMLLIAMDILINNISYLVYCHLWNSSTISVFCEKKRDLVLCPQNISLFCSFRMLFLLVMFTAEQLIWSNEAKVGVNKKKSST